MCLILQLHPNEILFFFFCSYYVFAYPSERERERKTGGRGGEREEGEVVYRLPIK